MSESLFVVVYPGRDTADQVYDTLWKLRKEGKISIKTAATVYRTDSGKLRLKHRRRVTVWKGAIGGGIIGLLLVGTGGGALATALIGALIGSSRARQRREVRKFLEDKLGPNDSALAILVNDADWAAVADSVAQFGGEEVAVELSPEAEEQLAKLAQDEEVVAAVSEEIEMEEEE